MASNALAGSVLATPLLSNFTTSVAGAKTPKDVLDVLQVLAGKVLPLSVLGAARMPLQTSDWRSTRLGRDAFLHSSVPKGWWEEYADMAAREYDPGVLMARSSLMACTWTETTQMLTPIGIDRWPYELSIKYGMRDALTCSVGRRWLIAYWSKQVSEQVSDAALSHRSVCSGELCRSPSRAVDRSRPAMDGQTRRGHAGGAGRLAAGVRREGHRRGRQAAWAGRGNRP